MIFTKEEFGKFVQEAGHLLQDHWEEVDPLNDEFELSIDLDQYLALQEVGLLHVYTARQNDKIVGYFILILCPHLHYSRYVAHTDVVYVVPEYRGSTLFYKLLKLAEQQAEELGAECMMISLKDDKLMSSMKRHGYRDLDTTIAKVFH